MTMELRFFNLFRIFASKVLALKLQLKRLHTIFLRIETIFNRNLNWKDKTDIWSTVIL